MRRRPTRLLLLALALPLALLAACDGSESSDDPDYDDDPAGEYEPVDPAEIDVAPARPGPAIGPDPVPESAGPRVPPAPESPPDAAAIDAERAAALLERLDALAANPLVPPVSTPPPAGLSQKETLEFRNRIARDQRDWKAGCEELEKAATAYLAAAGWEAAAPRAFRLRGLSRGARSDREGGEVSWPLRHHAVADLERYVERAPADDPHLPEAHAALGRLMLLVAGDVPERWRAALPHLEQGAEGLLADGRADEAGLAAYLLFSTLLDLGEDGRAADLADRLDVDAADFGSATPRVRQLTRRARLRPGRALPPLPAVSTTDGRPLDLAQLSGSPYVLHFFKTDVSSTTREIETILVPLRDRWAGAGLELIGVSLDWEMTPEFLESQKKLQEEVGDDYVIYDGKLASVRAWLEERGMDWRWYWDGKWSRNEVALALGVPTNRAYAILVGADGTVRWRGEPYKGLAEAVADLMEN